MSKKLIAVASAAALALTGLVGIAPAIASGPAAAFSGADGGNGSTSTLAASESTPWENHLDAANTADLDISGLATGDVVRVEATGAIRVLSSITGLDGITATSSVDVSKLGGTTVTKTTEDDEALKYFVYTTSTATDSIKVTVTRTGLSFNTTLYFKGTVDAGSKYKVVDVAGVPAVLAKGAKAVVSFKVTDAFGNQVEGTDNTVSGFNLEGAAAAIDTKWSASKKVYEGEITSATNDPFILTINAGTVTDVTVFGDSSLTSLNVINNKGASSQVAALTAQVATLTATVAKRVSKKKYNTLARKWNAAFPSQKVALKK